MRQAPVSVVIPTYNSAPLVPQAVESALAQTVRPARVIVVDDGSRDDTRERLRSYRDRIQYVPQENRGVAAARNRGIRQADTEFVAFLDADDVWHPRKLELQMDVLARSPDLGLLGTRIFPWPAPAFPDVPSASAAEVIPVPWQRLVVRNYLTTSTVVARRRVLEQVGPFDTALQGPEDYDLWLRIAEVTGVANLALPLTGYRTVAGSLSQQAVTMEAGLTRILHKLDARQVWRGRWLLRRKAYSYLNYSSALLHGEAGLPAQALRRLLRSFAWYPLPHARREVRASLARLKVLAGVLLQIAHPSRVWARNG